MSYEIPPPTRAFLFLGPAPEPEAGDLLLFAGPLLELPEEVAYEFISPQTLENEAGQQTDPTGFIVDGVCYSSAQEAAIDFVLSRLSDTATLSASLKKPVTVVRRQIFESEQTPIALQLIAARREEQNRKHGVPEHDQTHTVGEFRKFMDDYCVEICRVLEEADLDEVAFDSGDPRLAEAATKFIDVAALATAMLECSLRSK